MTEYFRVTAIIPNIAVESINAHSKIVDGKVHLFLPRIDHLPSLLGRVTIVQEKEQRESQLFDCRLLHVGEETDEYVASEAFIGEELETFKKNSYNKVYFTLSDDILRFFDTPWDIHNAMGDPKTQQ